MINHDKLQTRGNVNSPKKWLPLGRDNCLSNFLGERMMDWVKWVGGELFEEFEAEAEADASRRGI